MRKAICLKAARGSCFRVTFILFFLVPQTGLAYSTDYRFNSQPYDSSSDLYYFNQRYYNPFIGQFAQKDPLSNMLVSPDFSKRELTDFLSNPQRLNNYSYAGNNPVVFQDLTGLLTIIVPGTFYSAQKWSTNGSEQDFIQAVADTFKETRSTQVINDQSVWSGADNDFARRQAAEDIAELIKNYGFSPAEQLNIVGYSHGGNIAILVSRLINRKIDNLVTLATPVRPDYQPDYQKIGRHVNAYSIIDLVQVWGGNMSSLSRLAGSWLLGPVGAWLGAKLNYGDFGLAGRTYRQAENINVTSEAGLGLISSHFMTRAAAVWAKIGRLFK